VIEVVSAPRSARATAQPFGDGGAHRRAR